jgi:putative peptidoglycan lipid II flippase
VGLVAGAVALAVLVARSWGDAALAVPVRPVAAGIAGAAAAAVLGWWLGGLWTPDGLLVAAVQAVAVALAATAALVLVVLLVDRSVLTRLRPRRPASSTAGSPSVGSPSDVDPARTSDARGPSETR